MRWGVKAGPGVLLQDGLARGRVTAGGKNHPVPGGMIETAENLRREYEISREEQDEYAVRSHQRAAAAPRSRPVRRRDRAGDRDQPEGRHRRRPRRAHPPRLERRDAGQAAPDHGQGRPGGHRHRGQRQRAERRRGGLRRHHPEKAAELGLRPLARLVSWGVGGVPPKTMGIGPVPATAKALALAGVKLADVDLIELNEAFASQVLAVTREWGFTDERLRADQRQRLGHLPRPPGRRDRRAASSPRCSARWTAATPATASRPCASAAARASPPCSSGWDREPRMSGRVAIVTGAARGIGAATALRLAADGFAVAVLDLKEDDARDTVQAIEAAGGRALAVGADVGDAEQVQAAVDRIAAELGPPVVLVNNAGVTRDNLLFKMTDDDWDLVMHVHLRGSFLMTRAVQKHMVEAEVGPDGQPVEHVGAGQPRPGQLRDGEGRACRASPRPSRSSSASSASPPTRSRPASSSPT